MMRGLGASFFFLHVCVRMGADAIAGPPNTHPSHVPSLRLTVPERDACACGCVERARLPPVSFFSFGLPAGEAATSTDATPARRAERRDVEVAWAMAGIGRPREARVGVRQGMVEKGGGGERGNETNCS